MRVVSVGQDNVMVEIKKSEFLHLFGINPIYSESKEYDLRSFITAVYQLKTAVEARSIILKQLDMAARELNKVFFPLGEIKSSLYPEEIK